MNAACDERPAAICAPKTEDEISLLLKIARYFSRHESSELNHFRILMTIPLFTRSKSFKIDGTYVQSILTSSSSRERERTAQGEVNPFHPDCKTVFSNFDKFSILFFNFQDTNMIAM